MTTVTDSVTHDGRAARPARSSARADIQALRALAVLSVLAYHGLDSGLRGGFIGVDVFFVISGFLIGGGLVRELLRSGGIRLSAFYARRARRILPMALLASAATLIGSLVWASPARMLLWGQPLAASSIVKDGIASTVYLPNVWFAAQQRDYLADDAVSPFLHFWSLGIEEQFYFVVPVALALAWLITKRSLRNLTWAIGVFTAASLVFGAFLTRSDPTLAYFHPATRAWELGAGVLVAIAVEAGRIPSRMLSIHAGRFLAALVLAAVLIWAPWESEWPGWAATIPVGATALLLWLGSVKGASDGWWGIRPIQRIGDWSYSLYLWHWPLLVLAPLALERDLRTHEAVVLMAGAIVLSGFSYRLVEQPFRRSSVKTAHDRGRIFKASGIGIVLTLLVAGGVAVVAERATASSEPWSRPYVVPFVYPTPHGTPTPTGTEPPVIPEPVFAEVLPGNIRPALTDASNDRPRGYSDGCIRYRGEEDIPEHCLHGSGERPIVAVFGDSHAVQWLEPFAHKADSGEISVLSLTASACPPMYLDMAREEGTWRPHCDAWRTAALAEIDKYQPDVLIVSVAGWYLLDDESDRIGTYTSNLREMLRSLPSTTEVVFVSDTPRFADSRLTCVANHPTELSRCGAPIAEVLDLELAEAMREVVLEEGGTYLDMTPYICSSTTCGVVQGDVLMYWDAQHLTVTFVMELAPVLLHAAGLDEVLDG
ncbi:MAG: acyltransferase [Demequinaceae bacterium]|nr:acyltransferase [Demequinaceae bacterium]